MNDINEAKVRKIASIARLELTDQEIANIGSQLKAILSSFATLADCPTTGVEPLVTPVQIEPNWHPDEVKPGLGVEASLDQAPARVGNSFKVPPVV